MDLDASQQKFVDSNDEFVRLIAPAGAGKTQSLLQRCVRLAGENPGDRILIFAFTRAARNELVARLQTDPALRRAASSIKVMTLNAWGNRMVRNTATKARLVSSQWDQKTVLDNALQPVWTAFPAISSALLDRRQVRAGRVIMDAMEKLKSLGFRHDQTDELSIQKHVDWLTDLNLAPGLVSMARALEEFGIANSTEKFAKTMSEEFIPFWTAATDTLFSQGFYTFEDQKYRPLLWLEDQIERGTSLTGAARTAHIVVDEFQDINPLDLELIKKLTIINSSTLTLVGDDDQAIFEWRGSSPDFILSPETYFQREFQTFILETNYRSPRNVVELSQQLIKNNVRRVEKDVKANSTETAEISVVKYTTVSDCVSETTSYVRSLLQDDSISSIALISRKRSQILPYQITFAAEDIPFYAAEDLNLGLSKAFEELQVLLAIRAQTNLAASPFGPSPWELVIKMADKVRVYPLSKSDRTGLIQYFKTEKPASVPEAVALLRTYTGPLKGSNTDAANSREFARSMNLLLDAPTVTAALQAISHGFTGLQKDWGKSEEDVYYTDPPFFYLAAMAEPYKDDFERFYMDIKAALAKLAQVPEDDGIDDSYDENQIKSKLHLMTALRAKGREFDAVIVLDSNDDIWPIRLAKSAPELEQERRLFYVAMTRTKKRLRFVYSSQLFEARDEQSVEAQIPELEVDLLSEIDPLGLLTNRVTMNASRYLGEMKLFASD